MEEKISKVHNVYVLYFMSQGAPISESLELYRLRIPHGRMRMGFSFVSPFL